MNKTILLAGNPNVGKSVIFNKFTNSYAVVSNYPGTTVEISRGTMKLAGEDYNVIDSPGIYSTFPASEDEHITRELIIRERPDIILLVCDMKNIERSLQIFVEISAFDIPMLVALNMADEAESYGIEIDTAKLSNLLGVPVIATNAIMGDGLGKLKESITKAKIPALNITYPKHVTDIVEGIEHVIEGKVSCPKGLSMFIASGDKTSAEYFENQFKPAVKLILNNIPSRQSAATRLAIFETNNAFVKDVVSKCKKTAASAAKSLLTRFGDWSAKPLSGTVILLFVIYVMYEFVGVFAAGTVVDFLNNTVFAQIITPALKNFFESFIHVNFINDFLTGPYGVFSTALPYALAIIFPIVTAFFLFFGLLEDSGYLPRLSALLDKIFRYFGLNGKAILPMVVGLGCGTMAVMTSRIMETKKERLMLVILLSLAIPCSAQIGVILGLLASIAPAASIIWALSLLFSVLFVGKLMEKLLKGEVSDFILEIPPVRVPGIKNILTKVKMRLIWYMKEVIPLFIYATAFLFVLDKLKVLNFVRKIFAPVVVKILELPAEITDTFIMGFLRRDYGAVGLWELAKQGTITPLQILTGAIVITLLVPCLAQSLMVVKEHGIKKAFIIFAGIVCYAVGFGYVVKTVVSVLGIL
jgi:ferrous iron transport protein B